jgi:two-component system sensor histidine kinase HydH
MKKKRFDISVWVAVSAIAVLAVILGMMIFIQSQQRKDQAVILFLEKGATLIRSFEAALPDLPDRKEEEFYLQKLLMITAQQPDIDYLIVTDREGRILADSDPSMVGRPYGLDLDVKNIAPSQEVRWRQTANPEGAGTFEVYRGFFPGLSEGVDGEHRPFILFVGFNMEKIEKASREDAVRIVVRAIVLVLIGSLAIVSLFLVQAYRLTRSSLSRVTVFSDAVVRHMPAGLLAMDQTGKIVTCNVHAQELFTGVCPDAVGRKAADLLPAQLLQLLDRINEKTRLAEEDVTLPSEKEGHQVWEAVAAAFSGDDVPEGKILLARNVTAIRQMEKEVVRSRHLNAIGSLAAGVAHEIRNPLSSIKGFAVYFRQRLSGNKEDEETADIMIAETERLNRVISQLLEFARPLTLKKEPTHMMDLVRHTIRLVEAEARKDAVEIDVRGDEKSLSAEIDPDKVKQVLLNVFLNALSAMPGGGKLSVRMEAQKEFLEVTVSDTGTGIRKNDLPRIFDPYYTSKPAGTGLGLAVVQKIMEAHGGTVGVESNEGCGTKVTLRFFAVKGD